MPRVQAPPRRCESGTTRAQKWPARNRGVPAGLVLFGAVYSLTVNLFGLASSTLGSRHGQDAVLVLRLHLVGRHGRGQRQGALEFARNSISTVNFHAFLDLFGLRSPEMITRAVVQRDVNVLASHARQFRADDEALLSSLTSKAGARRERVSNIGRFVCAGSPAAKVARPIPDFRICISFMYVPWFVFGFIESGPNTSPLASTMPTLPAAKNH